MQPLPLFIPGLYRNARALGVPKTPYSRRASGNFMCRGAGCPGRVDLDSHLRSPFGMPLAHNELWNLANVLPDQGIKATHFVAPNSLVIFG